MARWTVLLRMRLVASWQHLCYTRRLSCMQLRPHSPYYEQLSQDVVHSRVSFVSAKWPHPSPSIRLGSICLIDVFWSTNEGRHAYDFLDSAFPHPFDWDMDESKLLKLPFSEELDDMVSALFVVVVVMISVVWCYFACITIEYLDELLWEYYLQLRLIISMFNFEITNNIQ